MAKSGRVNEGVSYAAEAVTLARNETQADLDAGELLLAQMLLGHSIVCLESESLSAAGIRSVDEALEILERRSSAVPQEFIGRAHWVRQDLLNKNAR